MPTSLEDLFKLFIIFKISKGFNPNGSGVPVHGTYGRS
jgi:hypothetical protein